VILFCGFGLTQNTNLWQEHYREVVFEGIEVQRKSWAISKSHWKERQHCWQASADPVELLWVDEQKRHAQPSLLGREKIKCPASREQHI